MAAHHRAHTLEKGGLQGGGLREVSRRQLQSAPRASWQARQQLLCLGHVSHKGPHAAPRRQQPRHHAPAHAACGARHEHHIAALAAAASASGHAAATGCARNQGLHAWWGAAPGAGGCRGGCPLLTGHAFEQRAEELLGRWGLVEIEHLRMEALPVCVGVGGWVGDRWKWQLRSEKDFEGALHGCAAWPTAQMPGHAGIAQRDAEQRPLPHRAHKAPKVPGLPLAARGARCRRQWQKAWSASASRQDPCQWHQKRICDCLPARTKSGLLLAAVGRWELPPRTSRLPARRCNDSGGGDGDAKRSARLPASQFAALGLR